MTLKPYHSHKIVKADKIVSFEKKTVYPVTPEGEEGIIAAEEAYILHAEDGTKYQYPLSLFARGEPKDDYFYLVQQNDCIWWETKEVFENGYSEC